MKRIYIAGAYSANNVLTVLDNMREGMRLATKVLLLGYAPFYYDIKELKDGH